MEDEQKLNLLRLAVDNASNFGEAKLLMLRSSVASKSRSQHILRQMKKRFVSMNTSSLSKMACILLKMDSCQFVSTVRKAFHRQSSVMSW